MRIGIDARLYGTKHGGIGRYSENLIKQLEVIDSANQYFVFLQPGNFEAYQPKNNNFTKVLADFKTYGFGEQILFPKLLNKYKLDLVHFTHFNVPLFYFRPFIVTVHDLIISHYPNSRATTLNPLFYRLKLAIYKIVLKSATSRAKSIIAVSEYTKKDLNQLLLVDKNKITVTYEGVQLPILNNIDCQSIVDNRFRVKDNFLLYVGSAYPHKNLESLIKAFKILASENSNLLLVLVGDKNYFYLRLNKEIEALGLSDRVILTGYINDQELSCLYKTAQLYVFPSLLEGFGLPPLEAQSYGLPVVSSSSSCLPEILGDSAVYFNPHGINDMVSQINQVLNDQFLADDLSRKGSQNIKKYSWKKCAKITRSLYVK